MALSHMTFVMLSYIPSKANLLSIFLVNQTWILSNASSASIEMIIWFLPFILLIWCTTLIDSWMLKHPWIRPWNKPGLIMVYDPFNILLNSICLYFCGFLCLCSTEIIFFSCSILSGFSIKVMLAWLKKQKWVWKCSLFFHFLEEFEKD